MENINKKEIKRIFLRLAARIKEIIFSLQRKTDGSEFMSPDEIVEAQYVCKVLKEFIEKKPFQKSKLENICNVFMSDDKEQIMDYMENKFNDLPHPIRTLLFHETSSFIIDGTSIYSQLSSFNLLSMADSDSNLYIDSLEVAETMRNLFKVRHNPSEIETIFPKYLNNVDYGSFKDLAEDLIEFSSYKFKRLDSFGRSKDESYFFARHYIEMIEKYINSIRNYSLQSLMDFYNDLTSIIEQSRVLQEINIFSYFQIFKPFLESYDGYENLMFLMQNDNFKKQLYRDERFALKTVLWKMEPEVAARFLSEYVQSEEYVPSVESSEFIIDILIDVKDKSLFVDFDLMMPIYMNLVLDNIESSSLAKFFTMPLQVSERGMCDELFQDFEREALGISEDDQLPFDELVKAGQTLSDEQQKIRNQAIDNLKQLKMKKLISDYYTYGLIDEETYQKVVEIAQKFNKNITLEKIKEVVAKNENLKNVLQFTTLQQRKYFIFDIFRGIPEFREGDSPYQRAINSFEAIFPRTRLFSLPELDAYKKMTAQQKSKFNVKVWNQFASLPLFSRNSDTKCALVEFIGVMGLFEDDEQVEERRKVAYAMATEYGEKMSVREFETNNIALMVLRTLNKNGKEQEIKDLLSEEEKGLKEENLSKNEIQQLKLSAIRRKYFQPCKVKRFQVRNGVEIPEQLKGYFEEGESIGETSYSQLKNLSGSFGKKMGNFLSPYAKEGDKYRLKKGVEIPEEFKGMLGEELTERQYKELLANEKVALFLNPIQEIEVDGLMPREDLTTEENEMILNVLLESDLPRRMNIWSIHRMFDGCKQEFNPEVYQLYVDNLGLFLEDEKRQSMLKSVQLDYEKAKAYFARRGNSEPNLLEIFDYLDNTPFTFGFGRDEFAQEAKNAGIKTQERYSRYEQLLPALEKRRLTTIPRHKKVYTYVGPDGKEYKVMSKILRLDDQTTMLVGETNFTNCCQVLDNAGEDCMLDATTSNNGGILAVYVINDQGIPEMITQSWIWTRETKLCLDNVEGTDLVKRDEGGTELYKEMATFAIKETAKDLIETSKKGVDAYVEKEAKKINRSKTLTPEQKQKRLEQLEVLRARQTLKTITVGEGFDDLNVAESFPERESVGNSQGPKGYFSYRDSDVNTFTGKSNQHIILKSQEEVLPDDEEYIEVPIYRDERRIFNMSGEQITHAMLKHITDIEKQAHKSEMVNFTEEGPVLYSTEQLAEMYNCREQDLHILAGEDWYFIYIDDGIIIEICDLARSEPRIEDEGREQQQEISKAFNTILSQSIVIGDECSSVKIKPINVDLREDTSYLLYLHQKRRGIIEQVGSDVSYPYGDELNQTQITEKQQEEFIRNAVNINRQEYEKVMIHHLTFVPTEKTIKKILDKALLDLEERSFNNE